VKRVLPPIAARIRSLLIRTTTPVQVRLVPFDELQGLLDGHGEVLGVTVSLGSEVVDLMVARDLPLARFGAVVAVYGHLHIPRTTFYDGVRFEEVSVGYPREWRRRDTPPGRPRRILS